MTLETELAYYATIKSELLKHHEGKFALVIGNEQLGVFDKREEAYAQGIAIKGNVPMLIKQIQKVDPIEHIPAMVLGLINAHS
ncbi:MAG: hypothetical protein ABI824_07550 [Acidobacteriota bacterium]